MEQEADALRRALIKLDELWPILFDELYDERTCDHWLALRTKLEARLSRTEHTMRANYAMAHPTAEA